MIGLCLCAWCVCRYTSSCIDGCDYVCMCIGYCLISFDCGVNGYCIGEGDLCCCCNV